VLTGLTLQESFNACTAVKAHPDKFHIVFGHAPDFALGPVDADLLWPATHTAGRYGCRGSDRS